MPHPVVIVPGIFGSGPTHWQTRWEQALPDARRFAPSSWDEPDVDDWVAAIDRAIADAPTPPMVVAHSLGCLAVAEWAVRTDAAAARVAGVFLVAPPDPDAPAYPAGAAAFAIADGPLGVPAVVLASSDDPYAAPSRIASFAARWGAGLVELGERGHVNADSGLGEWPEGLRLLEDFTLTARRAGGPPAG
ncbi:alpha/beta hydrolase [Agromyces tropicus]|uniref:Alpha/beta hydrolase n=1 Tax=Agromyces tropicus TaxID=555371 RepID=A0ABP5FPV8_9MICO